MRKEFCTTEDLKTGAFCKLPRELFDNPKYMGMKSESKIAYALLTDLTTYSPRIGWINDKGQVYIKIDKEKLGTELNIKNKKEIEKVIKELVDLDLIVIDEDRIYIQGVEHCE